MPRLRNGCVARFRSASVLGVVALAFAIAAPLLSPTTASAAVDGAVSYSIENDQVTITGCSATCPSALVIPATIAGKPVVAIADGAFSGQAGITSVSMPEGLRRIGAAAFQSASSLRSVSIPSSVTSLGDYAFFYTPSLTTVSIAPGLTSIGFAAFAFATALPSISIPNGVTTIGANAFYGASSLASVSLPSGVTSIADYVFYGASSLASVSIPTGVTSIGVSAFSGASSLASVSIPSGVTSIGELAFNGLTAVTSITIPSTVTSIGRAAFQSMTALASVSFAAGSQLTSIPESAFRMDPNLTTVTIPSSVTSIAGYAFYEATALSSVSIPSSVKSIGEAAFGKTGLTSVSIPSGVTSIGAAAFKGASSLTSVSIPSTVTSIGASAFQDASSLTSVSIPDGVATMGASAFQSATSLRSVSIPSSLTSIADAAFFNTPSLTNVSIARGVTSIGYAAFAYATSLSSVSIPRTVTSFGHYVFYGASSLSTVTFLGNAPYSVGSGVFYGVPSGATAILISASPTGFGSEGSSWNGLTVHYAPDTEAPIAPSGFTGVPSAYTQLIGATVGFTLGESGGTVECRLDTGDWAACTSVDGTSGSFTVSGLGEGSHSVGARQTDAVGNVSQVGTSPSWVVDRTAPIAPLLSGIPAVRTNSTSASVGFAGEANAVFTCSVDGGDYSGCGSSPKALSSLAEGAHSLAVKQTDRAGNTSIAATAAWTVDLTAPPAPVLSGVPGSLTDDTDAWISFTGEVDTTFTCSVDGGTYSACGSSPKVLSGLAPGVHSVSVKATDLAGNVGAATTAIWRVGAGPSAPSISGQPSGEVSSTSASITLTGEAGGSFICSLDRADYEPCSSPLVLTGLDQGAHSLRVRSSDAAGNLSYEAAVAEWRVNTQVPDAPMVESNRDGLVSSTTAHVEASGDADTTLWCSVDGGDFAVCDLPLDLTGLNQGLHSVAVKQVNRAGTESAVATTSWTVDTAAPAAPSVSGAPTGSVNTTSASVAFSGSEDNLAFKCSLDGSSFRPCGSSPFSVTDLADGSHSLAVKAVDQAGNDSSVVTQSWTVDTVAPESPVVGGNRSGFTKLKTAVVRFNGDTDPASTLLCSVDGGDYSAAACGSSPRTFTGLSDGVHSFSGKQVDLAGNESDVEGVSWTVDTVSPVAPALISSRSGVTNLRAGLVSFTGEASAKFECRLNTSSWVACTDSKSVSNLRDGPVTVSVRQTDRAGNVSAIATKSWTVATLVVSSQSVISVNGTANVGVGSEVSASAYAFSGSAGVQSLVRSWSRCTTTSSSSCTTIADTDSDSYTATVNDFGKRLMFTVAHTSTDGAVATETSSMTGVVVPVATSTPLITIPEGLSTPAYGRKLGVTGPTWRGLPDGTPVLYQWQRCSASGRGCSNIAGQTKSTYTVAESSVGRRLRLLVGVDTGPVTVSASTSISGLVNVIANNTTLPSLSYTAGLSAPKRGKDVSVRSGSWSYTLNGDFTYQWQACDTAATSSCSDISGETDKRYTPTALIVGKRLRVLVTYTSPTGDVLTAATAVSGVAVR